MENTTTPATIETLTAAGIGPRTIALYLGGHPEAVRLVDCKLAGLPLSTLALPENLARIKLATLGECMRSVGYWMLIERASKASKLGKRC